MSFDPRPAASLLAETWRAGRQLDALPEAIRPADIDQGYAVQDALLAEIGEAAAGWKLAVGSHKGKRASGLGRPIAGRVLARHLHGPDATVTLPPGGPVTIEFEIAYVLGRDVPPDAPPGDALEAVGETRVAFELVRSRFVDRRAVGWPSFAADNAAFQALVLGLPVAPADLPALARDLVVSVDGVPRARALTGEDETVPTDALADLLALARERGFTLPHGSIVSTGTLSAPFDLAGPGVVEATYLGTRLGFTLGIGAGA